MKLLVIGSQLSGKTTLSNYLRKQTTVPIYEIDEEILKSNNNKWPDDKYKDNVLIPKIYKIMAAKDDIIFFIKSAFPTDALLQFKKASFKIVLLKLSRDEIVKRNEIRMKHEEYPSAMPYIDGQLANHKDMYSQGFIDEEIDATQSTENIAKLLLKAPN